VPNQDVSAGIVGGSLVQANVTATRHSFAPIVAGSSVTPTLTGNYAGTTAHLAVAGVSISAHARAQLNAQGNIAGFATFTTWVIFELNGNVTGHGILEAATPPVTILLVSGAISGAGTIKVTYVADVPMLASSSVSATAQVDHGAHASLGGRASVSATARVPKPAAAIVGEATLAAQARVHKAAVAGIFPNSTLTAHASTQTVDMVAGSSLSAAAHRHRRVIATIAADSTLLGSTTIVPDKIAAVAMAASASVAASPVVIPAGSQAALIVASSSVVADATLNHGVHPPNPAAPVITLILGAQFAGAGTVKDKLLLSLTGVVSGAGAISGTASLIASVRALPMVGAGTLGDSIPLPMIGAGILSGFYELQRLPRPICPCPPRRVKIFRWGQTLARGDLEFRVCDDSGNPFAPVVVLYAFYQIVAGGQRMLVGPPNRRPAVDNRDGLVGRYYATGTAGELGQPGEWVCVWRYQRSWWTETKFVEEPFKVHDEVTSGLPGSLSGRCRKFGWL